jgi:hypothetical protein
VSSDKYGTSSLLRRKYNRKAAMAAPKEKMMAPINAELEILDMKKLPYLPEFCTEIIQSLKV